MKKLAIYSFMFVLCGMTAACTKTTTIPADEYEGQAKISLSTDKLVFSIDGGVTVLVVAANTDSWEYTAEGDWFTVERLDDRTLKIEASVNGSAAIKSGLITVTGTKNGVNASNSAEVVQRADKISIDLSADGTANCYIAKPNTVYKFNATVKGNGGGDGGRSTYIDKYSVEINDIAYVDLLWEARNDGDRTLSREVIEGMPTYGGGYVSFSTGRSQGNALIAAYDIAGNILWSWHIWVLNDEIDVHDHSNGTQVVAKIMDRNLGALNNTPMDVNNRGMFYQWGRKDPFPASRSAYIEDPVTTTSLPKDNVPNDEVGNGSGKWNFHQPAIPEMEVPGNIPYTIKNPMTFIACWGNVYEWYCIDESLPAVSDSRLWGTEKTIFDPCPVGYKVPGNNMWGVAGGAKDLQNGGGLDDYDQNGENPDYDWNVWKDGGRTWKHTGDYYPAVGTLSINANSEHANTGIYGFYWSAQNCPANSGYSYWTRFIYNWAYWQGGGNVFSAQIRCVKE